MAAEIMMGVYFNLSFWYKLIDKTIWGAWFSGAGCLVLIVINVVFVPQYGYMACAWAGFAGYATAMLFSYFVGQKYYPIDYRLGHLAKYIVLAVVVFAMITYVNSSLDMLPAVAINTVLIAFFALFIVRNDFPVSAIIKKIKK